MSSPVNKENVRGARGAATTVAKRGSVVLAPVPSARHEPRPRQETNEVLQLVTAVRDHLRFRSLVTYAVDTFAKALAPPNAQWRAYVAAALDVDAAATVVAALDAHVDDRAVLAACTTCLGRLAVDARHAAQIAKEGGVEGALRASARCQACSVEALVFVDAMCAHPRSFLSVATAAADVAKAVTPESLVHGARVLARLCGWAEGLGKVVKAKRDVSAALLAALAAAPDPPARAVGDAANVLSAIVDADGKEAPYLARKGAVDVFLGNLACVEDDAAAARDVARLLMRLVEDGIAELVRRLEQTGDARAAKLLAALAADGALAAEIARRGGVKALIAALEGDLSAAALEAAVDALHRLAAYDLPAGAVEALLACLARGPSSDASHRILRALNAIVRCQSVGAVSRVTGATATICKAVVNGATHAGVVAEGCGYVAALGDDDVEARALGTCEGPVRAVRKALKSHPAHVETQRRGLAALGGLARRNPALVAKKGGALLAVDAITRHGENSRIVEHAFKVLALVAQEDAYAVRDACPGAAWLMTLAPAAADHANSRTVRTAFAGVAASVATDAEVLDVVAELQAVAAVVTTGRDHLVLERLPAAAAAAAALGFCAETRCKLREAAASLVHVLTAVAGDARVDASTVRNLVTALAALEHDGFAQPAFYDDALRATIGVASSRCAAAKPAATALDFVARLAVRNADDALAAGAAEACAAVVGCQVHQTDDAFARVAGPAGACLLNLCATPQLTAGVAARNGARPCVAALKRVVDCPTHKRAVRGGADALRVLERLARTDVLRGRANALHGVFDAMEVVDDAAFRAQALATAAPLASDALARKAMQNVSTVVDFARLGRFLECRPDAPWADEAASTVTTALRDALHTEDPDLARACVVALHRSQKHATEDYAGLFLDELRRHPTRELLRDTVTLLGDEAFRAAFTSAGGVDVLLPPLRDATIVDSVERCLAACAAHPRGAADLLNSGAPRHACTHLVEDPTSVGAAHLLRALATHASAEQLRAAGGVRAVRAALLADDDDARERACGLVTEMPQLRNDFLASAPLLVKLLENNEDSPRAAACAIDAVCQGDDAVQTFVDCETAQKMMGAMRRWPDDDALARTCARVLARLSGGDGSGLTEVFASATTQCDTLPDALDALVADLRLAGHLVLLPGAVEDAGPVLDVITLVIARTSDENALDAAMMLLARLLQLQSIDVDVNGAARCIREALGQAARAAAAAVALGRRGGNGIRALHEEGVTKGFQNLIGTRDAHIDTSTLSDLLDAAAADCGALTDEAGARAFAELLNAVPGHALEAAVAACAQALLEALPLLTDAAAGPVVDMLVTHAATAPQVQAVPCRVEHVTALCRARADLGKGDALIIHAATLATPNGGKLCFGGYVPEFNQFIKGDLSLPEATRALAACEMVARGAGHGDAEINAGLVASKFPTALLDALKMPARCEDEAFAQTALYALRCLLEGSIEVAFDAARVVRAVAEAHPQNTYITETAHALIRRVEDMQAGGPGARVAARLEALHAIHAAAKDWTCALSDEGGDPYYYNSASKQSAWAQPPEHASLVAELDDLCELMEVCAGQVDPATCGALASILSTHARDAVSSRLAKILDAVGRDDDVASQLGDVCGLEHLILGLEGAPSMDHALHVVALLDRVAGLETMRARLGTSQYITILNQVCLHHMKHEAIVGHVVSIFGKLCTAEDVVIIEMAANVPYTLKWALQTHATKTLWEGCVMTASRLVAGRNAARTGYVCEQVAPELVAALETHGADADVVVSVLKCFGLFSLHDPSILTMVSHGVTPWVVHATGMHKEHAALLRTAVELFGNLGAAEDDELDENCTAYLVDGGAVDAIGAILDACRSHIDGDALALIGACFDALYNLANNKNAAAAVVDAGLCEACVHCARVYDTCHDLVVQAMKLIGVLTFDAGAVRLLSKCGAAAVLADALRSRADDRDFVYDAILGLANLATLDDAIEAFRHEPTRLAVLGDVLELHRDDAEIATFALKVMVRLAASDELSKAIAELVGKVARAAPALAERPRALAFELLAHLAYVPENRVALVAQGGVRALLLALAGPAPAASVLERALKTLDVLVAADVEYASVVLELNGRAAVEAHVHATTRSVADMARRALETIDAVVGHQPRGQRAALRGLGMASGNSRRASDVEPAGDPLGRYRAMLMAGRPMKEWAGGKAVARKIALAGDFASLVTLGSRGVKTRLSLESLLRCDLGRGAGHAKKKSILSPARTGGNAEACFVIKGLAEIDVLCGECNNRADAVALKDALNALLRCAARWPHRLASG